MTDTLDLDPPTPDTDIRDIPLDQLSLPAENIGSIDPDSIEQLTASIKELGVLQPITVVELVPGAYEVAFGRHRYVAAQEAGLASIPCVVRTFVDEAERWLGMLVENLQRRTVDPVAEGQAYERLVKLGLKQRDLAGKVGRSQSHVSKRLALAELPEAAHTALAEGRLSISGAESMARIKDRKQVEKLAGAKGSIQEWKIDEVVREEEREAAKAKLRQEQLDAGRTEVKSDKDLWSKYQNASEDDATHFFLSNYGGAQLLTVKAGAGKSGGDAKSRETAAQKRDRLAEEKLDAAYKAIATAHDAFIKAQLTGKLDAKIAQAHVNGWIVDIIAGGTYLEPETPDVAELLGLEIPEDADAWDEAGRLITEFAAKSSVNQLKVLVAGSVADRWRLNGMRGADDGEGLRAPARRFYSWLTAAGYQPSTEEQAELDRITAPAADDTAGAAE